jgi:hypothetical protein
MQSTHLPKPHSHSLLCASCDHHNEWYLSFSVLTLSPLIARFFASAPAAPAKKVTPESVLKKRKANEKLAAERVAKDIERRKVVFSLNLFSFRE